MPFIVLPMVLPFKLTCVSVRLCVCCRRVGNAYELVGNELRALLHKRTCSAAARPYYGVRSSSRGGAAAVAAAAVAGCCCGAVRGGVSSGEP